MKKQHVIIIYSEFTEISKVAGNLLPRQPNKGNKSIQIDFSSWESTRAEKVNRAPSQKCHLKAKVAHPVRLLCSALHDCVTPRGWIVRTGSRSAEFLHHFPFKLIYAIQLFPQWIYLLKTLEQLGGGHFPLQTLANS